MAQTIRILCNDCQQINQVDTNRLPSAGACQHCGDLLFEIDEQMSEIRITRRYREYYRQLSRNFLELRRLLLPAQNSQPGLARQASEALQITGNLLENENQLSDAETLDSTAVLLESCREYLAAVQTLLEQPETASQKQENQKAREVLSYLRMFDKYLGEQGLL